MTILLHGQVLLTEALAGTAELSSRPERSVVEGPAVSLPVLTQTLPGWAEVWRGGPTGLGSGCVLLHGSRMQGLMGFRFGSAKARDESRDSFTER